MKYLLFLLPLVVLGCKKPTFEYSISSISFSHCPNLDADNKLNLEFSTAYLDKPHTKDKYFIEFNNYRKTSNDSILMCIIVNTCNKIDTFNLLSRRDKIIFTNSYTGFSAFKVDFYDLLEAHNYCDYSKGELLHKIIHEGRFVYYNKKKYPNNIIRYDGDKYKPIRKLYFKFSDNVQEDYPSDNCK